MTQITALITANIAVIASLTALLAIALIAAGYRLTSRLAVTVDCIQPGNANRNYNDGGRWHKAQG